MARVSLEWHGARVKPKLRDAAWAGVRAAALYFQRELKRVIGISNRDGENPSSPGEPPRRGTGNLQKNVVVELEAKSRTARVGVGVGAKYGVYLEFGTWKIAARPWIRPTLDRLAGILAEVARKTARRVLGMGNEEDNR